MSASFYDLLKYAATGIASPDMTYYDKLRASTLMGGIVQTLTGIPPLSFKSDGSPLISWSMKGNGQQTGTPTPDNPVMPEFVGVRTGNLFDEIYPDISEGTLVRYKPIYVGNGTFTLSTTTPYDQGVANLFLLSGNVSVGASTSVNGAWYRHNVTTQASNGFITIGYRQYPRTISPADCKTMLNSGSTALPYEPYGWAEKITCAGQTTPVYLGEVPTVRRVKKLVFDGTEEWSTDRTDNFYSPVISDAVRNSIVVCSHQTSTSTLLISENCFISSTGRFNITTTAVEHTTTAWKQFLSDEYAAGHPVSIWYVLANEQTAIVNEPLCKIGTYADEMHSEDAAVTIPTAKGSNTLTVETELQPSEMTITFKG